MNRIFQKDWQAIIEGANLFGTGGGGTIAGANNILGKITKPVNIVRIKELKDDQLICTVFGVGGRQNCDPVLSSRLAMKKFQKILKKKIVAIIPVENGPMAIANAMFIASELSLPVLDSDIVGMRSSPEVYLETISIPDLQRTPCVISDGKVTKVIQEDLPLVKLEKVFRDFAIKSGGDAIVAGYPLQVKEVTRILPPKSISSAKDAGELLQKLKNKNISLNKFCDQTKWIILGKGKIIEVKRDTSIGFAQGQYVIKNKQQTFNIFFKNENLVVTKEKEIILTCPDSISLLDTSSSQALNNFEDNKGKEVFILGKKAIPIWRTIKGKKLFSPKNLGLPYRQVLLI